MTRREFIAGAGAVAASAGFGADQALKAPKRRTEDLIWLGKYELGWGDQAHEGDPLDPKGHYNGAHAIDPFDEKSFWWRIEELKKAGANMVYVPTMEAVLYPSHPEIALEGALQADRLYDLMKKVRDDYGMQTIPELNFATAHGRWLGIYSRMVSTPTYYKVCADLLKDVHDIFGKPKFINIGMDEESPDSVGSSFNVIRRGKLYWHDFNFYVDTIEKLGARCWCYADKIWWGDKEFFENCPKTVLLSNWYYSSTCDLDEMKALAEKAGNPNLFNQFKNYLTAFDRLEAAGYEQLPLGSDWYDRLDKAAKRDPNLCAENLPALVRYCTPRIAPERLAGFGITHWIGHNPRGDGRYAHFCKILSRSKAVYESL